MVLSAEAHSHSFPKDQPRASDLLAMALNLILDEATVLDTLIASYYKSQIPIIAQLNLEVKMSLCHHSSIRREQSQLLRGAPEKKPVGPVQSGLGGAVTLYPLLLERKKLATLKTGTR